MLQKLIILRTFRRYLESMDTLSCDRDTLEYGMDKFTCCNVGHLVGLITSYNDEEIIHEICRDITWQGYFNNSTDSPILKQLKEYGFNVEELNTLEKITQTIDTIDAYNNTMEHLNQWIISLEQKLPKNETVFPTN